MYDRLGQLLYVGKANNVRSRVLSHLREEHPRGLLPRWTRLVGRIDARLAYSEIEALLVEADLIARMRPGFNRRLKTWRKYCYLVQTDDATAPYSVSLQSLPWKRCFGPYRSRRQAVRIIEALHFAFAQIDIGVNLRQQVGDLLSGRNDRLAHEIEQRCEKREDSEKLSLSEKAALEYSKILRNAYIRGKLLREAETAWGGLTLLSREPETLTFAVVTSASLHLRRVTSSIDGMHALLHDYHEMVADEFDAKPPGIPKQKIDLLCLIAQNARRAREALRIQRRQIALDLAAEEMLAWCRSRD
jgi:hypothetical protein